jgi:SAM-dependent methyltransferase
MPTYWKKLIRSTFRLIIPPKILTDLAAHPISERFGLDRGIPVDRFYIEQFIAGKAHLIVGRVIEIAEKTYTEKYGKKVEIAEILHVDKNDKSATIIADLTVSDSVPDSIADTFICTQTLNFIYDTQTAVKSIHKILKPGGKAIITVAGLSQISRFDMDRWGDYWRFTDKSLRLLLAEKFGADNVHIEIMGNVYGATMLLQGIAFEEVNIAKLAVKDDNYQVILGAVVTKK